MADEAKAEDLVDELREAFAKTVRETLAGFPPHQALQMADALCTVQLNVLAGMSVRYRARPKVDEDAIAEDWRRGRSILEIVEKHGVSRSTAYACHPLKGRARKSRSR